MRNLLILTICLFSLASKCKKKEPKDYLVGSWGILTYKESGVDKTSDFNVAFQGYKISFDAKGNYTVFYRNLFGAETTINGTWTLTTDNLKLTLVDNNPNSSNKIREYAVLEPITETMLHVGEAGREYDLRKQ